MNRAENDSVKIDKISIDQFRRFKNVEFEIGNNITLIAGQNGTSKSTLLGMLCQPFSFGFRRGKDNSKYTANYHGLGLAKYHDIAGLPFFYDCEDVFRLSSLHDTPAKKYVYRLHLSGSCLDSNSAIFKKGLYVRAATRKDKDKKTERIRFVAGPGASQEAGEGNFPHPVIYLGLNRLWPMALVKKLDIEKIPELSNKDKDWYVQKYNEILLLEEHDNKTEYVKTGRDPKGDFIGPSSIDYNSESCSAGQDNLGQILTSILSFRHLKSQLQDKYQGGILLIDELDTAFHAVAQQRLLKTLIEISKELKLQIIATTHSLSLLKEAFKSSSKIDTKVLCLKKENENIVDSCFSSYEQLEANLYVDSPSASKKTYRKVSIFFEDTVGKWMFFGIIGRGDLKRYLNNVEMNSLDAGSLKNMAALSGRVTELSKVIFIPDGDVKHYFSKLKTNNNVIFLPGNYRPETLMYDNLEQTDDTHLFWSQCQTTIPGSYNRQVAINKPGIAPTPSTSKTAKDWYKKWYQEQSEYWGTMQSIAWKKWASDNKNECANFCKQFFKILNRVSPEVIPKSLFERVLEKYEG